MASKREKRKAISWKHRHLLQKEDLLGSLEQEHDTLSHLNSTLCISGAPNVSALGVAKRSHPALQAVWEMERVMSSVVTSSFLCSVQICFIYHSCPFAETIAVISLRWKNVILSVWGPKLSMYMRCIKRWQWLSSTWKLRRCKLLNRALDTQIK